MDFLQDYTTVKKLTLALKQLPTGSDAYDVAYEKAMKRITAQSEQRAQQAIETLTWIVYARGQLTGKELLQALAIEENSTELDPDNIPDMQDVLSCCIGIVSWDIETDIVRLVHSKFSLPDFRCLLAFVDFCCNTTKRPY